MACGSFDLAQQFDLVENLNPDRRGEYPYLVVLQHNRVSSTGSVAVAPVVKADASLASTRLHPFLEIDGLEFLVFVEHLAAIPRQTLGRVIGSADADRYAVIAALPGSDVQK
jgi:hypothetical protein